MNETNQSQTGSTARADVVWGRITRHSESGSAIEDRLAALVDAEPAGSRFRVDIFHPTPTRRPPGSSRKRPAF